MYYDENEGCIRVSLGELVSLSLCRLASEIPREGEEGTPPLPSSGALPGGIGEARSFSLEFEEGERRFCLFGSADGVLLPHGGAMAGLSATLTVVRTVSGDPASPAKETLRHVRGELFLLACLYFSAETAPAVHVRALLRSPRDGREGTFEETVTRAAADTFFARVRATLSHAAAAEVARVAERLPTLRTLRFPYPRPRMGQEDLIQATYRTIRHHRRLYACAPTGTGKTAGVLYPALRALGERLCDRVFYLTPKTTTARAAADALGRFAAAGGKLRAIVLTAKERICTEKMLCRDSLAPCRFARAGGERLESAALALLSSPTPVAGEAEVRAVAARFGVCPYELSLRYSRFCDVIIGDYNYLFDTRMYLRRYFSEDGNYCFLIDEAHDLLERAREMYSGELDSRTLGALVATLREEASASPLLSRAEEVRRLFLRTVKAALSGERPYEDADGVTHAFTRQKAAPEALFFAVAALAEEGLRAAQDRRTPLSLREKLRTLCYPLRNFATRAELYSDHFITFYLREDAQYRVRTVCLDPAEVLSARLDLGKSAVLFSATLAPLPFYRTVLGGRAEDEELLLDSPFEEEHLSVAVMDKISTRFTARTESAPAIAEAIYGMVSAHVGNYFVFCPSFAYLEEICIAFHRAYPAVKIAVQKRGAPQRAREEFLSRFAPDPGETLVGFCVTGGVFAEGIDLAGSRLIGAAVIGVSLPQLSPEREAICDYYQEIYEEGKQYAYIYPGMNRVLQAAGRVIRGEEDRGTLLLIDDRFADPLWRGMIPNHWHHLKFVGDPSALGVLFRRFWREQGK